MAINTEIKDLMEKEGVLLRSLKKLIIKEN